MMLNGMFFNQDLTIELNKKISKGTDILFPKIQSSNNKNPHKPKKSLISSDHEINVPASNKRHLSLVTKTNFFSANPKDLISGGKVKNLEDRDPIISTKFKKARPVKNFTVALQKCLDIPPQRLLTQTEKDINSFRNTFIVRKGQNGINSKDFGSNENVKNGKKSIGSYLITKELGHGGFAKVFEVFHKQTNVKYAMKEYILADAVECYQKEAKVGEFFFKEGQIKNEFSQSPGKILCDSGAQSIIRYVQRLRNNKKGYIIQEVGGVNFSKLLSEIKGAFHNKERVYEVKFLPFYQKMKEKRFFSSVMVQICQAIKLLNSSGFVHCDLKLQNILLEYDNQSGNFPVTITPEYMPPELLMQFDKNGFQGPNLFYQKIDVWSIGCIMFEIFTGMPLWFKYKCKICTTESNRVELGIFALTNRDYSKIIKRQQDLCDNIAKSISFVSHEWERYRGLLRQILVMNPQKRISIQDLISQLKEFK